MWEHVRFLQLQQQEAPAPQVTYQMCLSNLLPRWQPTACIHVCEYVLACACVHEGAVLKSCWLSLHTCLHLQDRQICLCTLVCVQRCAVQTVRDRQSSYTGQVWRQPGGCVHWAVTTNSCAGLYRLHPFISLSSTSSPFSERAGTQMVSLYQPWLSDSRNISLFTVLGSKDSQRQNVIKK